jgi:hypothetical protein
MRKVEREYIEAARSEGLIDARIIQGSRHAIVVGTFGGRAISQPVPSAPDWRGPNNWRRDLRRKIAGHHWGQRP